MKTLHKKLQDEAKKSQIEFIQKRNQTILHFLKDQQTKLFIQYIALHLNQLNFSEISTYSAFQISKLIFDPQLKQVENFFKQLVNQQCQLPQFVIIMFKILKISIQKAPYVLIGLRQMFTSISVGQKSITYASFFKYMIGKVVSPKDQSNNTQFQMRFTQNKKQDYLFHDKGIKTIFYVKDLKITICLDKNNHQLKIYDKDMKLTNKFSTDKDKHDSKNTSIIEMGYCQIYQKVGLLLDDLTISVINVKNLVSMDIVEFQENPLNEISMKHNKNMRLIYYLEMWGRWIAVDEENRIYKFDFQRTRAEDRIQILQIHIVDLTINKIIQFPNLNYVTIIAGNQIYFFNQNLSIKQYVFSHSCDIVALRYSQLQNKFYVSGQQTSISIFERDRLTHQFKVKTFDTGKAKITDFQVFSQIGVILVVDQNCDVKLFQYNKKMLTQNSNFKNIKKNQKNNINLLRISKNQFCLYESYLLMMKLQKIAIEPAIQIKFSPYYHYDKNRQLLYVSLNGNIFSLHLMRGQVVDEFTEVNSNIGKHHGFFLNENTHIFEVDNDCYIYDLYLNDEKVIGQNKNYKRKVNIGKIKDCCYDEQTKILLVWSQEKIYQLRNEGNNNFILINFVQLKNGEKIKLVQFSNTFCIFKMFSTSNIVYRINSFNLQIIQNYKYNFKNFQKKIQDQQIDISAYIDFTQYNLQILLSNRNHIFLIFSEKSLIKNIQFLKLQSFINRNLLKNNITPSQDNPENQILFTKIRYQKLKFKKIIPSNEKDAQGNQNQLFQNSQKYIQQYKHTLFVMDQTGILLELDLTPIFINIFPQKSPILIKSMEQGVKNGYMKGSRIYQEKGGSNIIRKPQARVIDKQKITICKKIINYRCWKAHQREVVQVLNVQIQKILVITYSNDSFIKLWNDQKQCLCMIKMPNFYKFYWKMDELQQARCSKNIQKTKKLIRYFQYKLKDDKQPISNIIIKTKNFKKQNPYGKVNILEPIVLQIQSRQVEQYMNKTSIFDNTIKKLSFQEKNLKKKELTVTQRSQSSPWKRNPKFAQLIDYIDKKHENRKLPVQLERLRGSLDIKKVNEISNISNINNLKLNFLPSLESYVPEPRILQIPQNKKTTTQEDSSSQNFEACLYVKNKRIVHRSNKFDQIDKQFERKRMQHFKYIQNAGIIKVNKTQDIRIQREAKKQGKGELIDNVKKIFEQHNKQVINTKRGRLIAMPKLKTKKQQIS